MLLQHFSLVLALCYSLTTSTRAASLSGLAVRDKCPNTTFHLSSAQVKAASLSPELACQLEQTIQIERDNWAESVHNDFYVNLPMNASSAIPGDVIKVERFTNPTLFSLPAGIAISRFIYMSETLNGTAVPASAFVLWPFHPTELKGIRGVPTVMFGHGSTGVNAECAPSHYRNLDYQFASNYELALAGFAVVAPDYAGLGVRHYPDGRDIIHEYLANPAAARDILFAQTAAVRAFPQLSSDFVIMGHSAGAGAAWGAAQLLAEKNFTQKAHCSSMWKGYRGTVALAPLTDIRKVWDSQNPDLTAAFFTGVAQQFSALYGVDYRPDDLLTPLGIARYKLLHQIGACDAAVLSIGISGNLTFKPGWEDSWYVNTFRELTANGARPFQGPMLVIQGDKDEAVGVNVTRDAIDATCKVQAHGLEYVQVPGMDHSQPLFAARTIWSEWIKESFEGTTKGNCSKTILKPLRPLSHYSFSSYGLDE